MLLEYLFPPIDTRLSGRVLDLVPEVSAPVSGVWLDLSSALEILDVVKKHPGLLGILEIDLLARFVAFKYPLIIMARRFRGVDVIVVDLKASKSGERYAGWV